MAVDDNLQGFVRLSDLTHEKKEKILANDLVELQDINFFRKPPIINFIDDGKNFIIDDKSYNLNVLVENDHDLKEVYLFVNDQKVYYKSFNDKKSSAVEKIAKKIDLKPGVNLITMVAREDDLYGQQKSTVVFSSHGDPFAS